MNPQRYECDVAVVGAGPAGIAAGATAAEAGARVLVIDEGLGPGGQIWRPSATIAAPRRALRWLRRLDASGATALSTMSVVGVTPTETGFVVRTESPVRVAEIISGAVILATGARELFLPFPGWTLPNVFGIGGVQALLKAGTDFRGKRVVISGSGPLMLPVAASLARSGASVLLVAEQAPMISVARYAASLWRKPVTLAQAASYRLAFVKSRYKTGQWVATARGDGVLREVTVTDGGTSRVMACDVLCSGFGLVPNTELARLIGCDVSQGSVVVDERQATTVGRVYAAGEPTGIGGVDLALVEGEIAGASAAGRQVKAGLAARRSALVRESAALSRAFELRAEVRSLAQPDTIVCRCEDVRHGDLDPSWLPRQAKLYTRVGMGACQGRVCGAALECLLGWPSDRVRFPIQPARVSTSALHSTPSADVGSAEQGVS